MIGSLGMLAYGFIWAFAWFTASSTPTGSPYTPPPVYTTPASPYLPSTGKIHVVQLRSADGPLKAQIGKQATEASGRGERAMIMTVSSSCPACAEIQGTFGDFEMQL